MQCFPSFKYIFERNFETDTSLIYGSLLIDLTRVIGIGTSKI